MSATTPPPGFLDFVEGQRRHFAASLPARVAGLESAWQAIAEGRAAPDEAQGLRIAAHGLAGSGALFGFQSLSEAARVLQHEVEGLVAGGPVPLPGRRAAIEAAIERVRRSVAEAP